MFYRTIEHIIVNINNVTSIEKFKEVDGSFKIEFNLTNGNRVVDVFITESLCNKTYESLVNAIRSNEVLAGANERPNNEKLSPIEQHDIQMQIDDFLNSKIPESNRKLNKDRNGRQ